MNSLQNLSPSPLVFGRVRVPFLKYEHRSTINARAVDTSADHKFSVFKLDWFPFFGQQAKKFVDAIARNSTMKFIKLGFVYIDVNVHRHFAECVRDHRSLTSVSVHDEYVQNSMVLGDVILAIGRFLDAAN